MLELDNLDFAREKVFLFEEKYKQIENMNCLTKTKKTYTNGEIFNLRGTRYYLIIQGRCWSHQFSGSYFYDINLIWRYKDKKKSEYRDVTLEDILDSHFVSQIAKTELLFNLNVFRSFS